MGDDFHRVVGKAGVTINACDNMAEGMIKVATATKVSDAAYQAYQNSLTNL
jgi:hypothetical protein